MRETDKKDSLWLGLRGGEPATAGAELGVRSLFSRVVKLPLEGDAIAKSLACRKHEGAKDVFAKFGTVRFAHVEATDRRIVEKIMTSHKKNEPALDGQNRR